MKGLLSSLNLVIALVGLISFSGCTFDKKEVPEQPLPDTVSYNIHIQPMFNLICATPGCHSGLNPSAGLTLIDSLSYNDLFIKHEINILNPGSSNLYRFMNSNMPPSGKVPYDVSLILKWMEQGAKNN